ncbi:hypothetical protein [Halopseudomonas pelagia]|uniref:Lipoprotein n=1 Tax=Halopseudomonas pelagia TaxID=553151 RepID=A0AA91U0D4_9GAMM|nr:hypothetical protein [Halopseudomonas pelagia]PCC98300.1 hypothetical protein CO192_16060 [Halopseudomonas pelagia]QFY56685.1 hypothetical protein EAO82_10055 [Halopseudomonas pelagia]
MKALLLATLLMSGCATNLADTATEDARQSLKNYGLTRCLLEALPEEQSVLREDLASASRAYHFMGKGAHQILQDEDTMDILHDPYLDTRNFVLNRYAADGSPMKSGNGNSAFHACLAIYNSAEFDQFVHTQDAYLP